MWLLMNSSAPPVGRTCNESDLDMKRFVLRLNCDEKEESVSVLVVCLFDKSKTSMDVGPEIVLYKGQ